MENNTPKPKKPIYKRIWFWILVAIVVIGINGAMNGNSDDKNTTSTSSSSQQKKSDTKTETTSSSSETKQTTKTSTEKNTLTEEEQDQKILDEYSQKIIEATPGLVNEYNTEAASNTAGLEGLAELSNKKSRKTC